MNVASTGSRIFADDQVKSLAEGPNPVQQTASSKKTFKAEG